MAAEHLPGTDTLGGFMSLFVSILAITATIWLLLQFTPRVRLDLTAEWLDPEAGLAKLKVRVENRSLAMLSKQSVLLQVLAYPLDKAPKLSEKVPFNTEHVAHGQEPLQWSDPEELCTGLQVFFPGEIATVEKICRLPDEGGVLHAGLQFTADVGPLYGLVSRLLQLNRVWTTTAFVARPR